MTPRKLLRGYIVAQIGARMHYAVPKILAEAGILCRLHTDACSSVGVSRLSHNVLVTAWGRLGRRMRDRAPEGIPRSRICTYETLAYSYALGRRLSSGKCTRNLLDYWMSRAFSKRVASSLDHEEGCRGLYAFNTAAIEAFEKAKKLGIRCVLEQTIASRVLRTRLEAEEAEHFPGWEAGFTSGCDSRLREREEEEWRLADLIVCGSEFVRSSVAGASKHGPKCVVVPYGIDISRYHCPPKIHEGASRRLRVLTVGAVGLRKGVQYVAAAAQLLDGVAEFRYVGRIGLTEHGRRQVGAHVELTGPVPRSSVIEHYRWADVFLLPSICEGSATVTYEALAAGLPVVCTPNAGSVVQHGYNGFIVPARDHEAIAVAIELLARDTELREMMTKNARESATSVSLDSYAHRLIDALNSSESTFQ